MGLKGYRLWAMGQLDSNVQSPAAPPAQAPLGAKPSSSRGVAMQVEGDSLLIGRYIRHSVF
jgi:hypothetical protein